MTLWETLDLAEHIEPDSQITAGISHDGTLVIRHCLGSAFTSTPSMLVKKLSREQGALLLNSILVHVLYMYMHTQKFTPTSCFTATPYINESWPPKLLAVAAVSYEAVADLENLKGGSG